MKLKASDVLSEWNTEAAAARSAAGSAEGSWELSMEAWRSVILFLCFLCSFSTPLNSSTRLAQRDA